MTPEICLMSVPHSGTQFTIEIFTRNGWHDMGLNGAVNSKPSLRQAHCEKLGQTMRAVELAKSGVPLVIPLRHPYRVEESWKRREKSLDALAVAYHHMFAHLAPLDPLWFPIDAAPVIRCIQLLKMMEVADKVLFVDWDTLVNAEKNTHLLEPRDLTPSTMIREIRNNPLFTEFYGDSDEPFEQREMRDDYRYGEMAKGS